jgi:hypothetical protein
MASVVSNHTSSTAAGAEPVTDVLNGCPWLWCATAATTNAYCGFVRRFTGTKAQIHLFAASVYHLYVDGRLINAGPTPFRAPVALVDSYDLTLDASQTEHEIFVLVNHFGVDTKWSLAGPPGLIAALNVDGQHHNDADGWQAYPLACWAAEAPRISWARGCIECFDAKHPDAEVLRRFASSDFAASSTGTLPQAQPVQTSTCPFTTFRPRLTPALTWHTVPVPSVPRIQLTNPEVYNLNDLALRLFFEQWHPAYDAEIVHCRDPRGTRIKRRSGGRGWVLTYDLDRVVAGEMAFTVHSDGPATIDLAFTERLTEGKPDPLRSGSRYVARLQVGAGTTTARLNGFHGFRYIVVVAKDFTGDLVVEAPQIHECYGNIPYADAFTCSDHLLELIHDISHRSVVLNTQAVCFDCNTRELGAYWGDGLWIADLVGHWSGDYSHFHHLCWGMVDEYAATGTISASLYGMGAPLFDYCLVPHELMRRYHRQTGDAATIRAVFPTAEKILDDFLSCRDEQGCVRIDRIRALFNGRHETKFRDGLLFLDHAGLGWHPRDTVGIDRSDSNAGLQCFLLQALQAMSSLATVAGVPNRWADTEAALRTTIRERYFDPELGLLRDARLEDGSFSGCSHIVNALAVMTGVFTDDEARQVMRTLLAIHERTDIAHATPYGWFFMCEASCRTGLVKECLAAVRQLFEPMLARGATTTWEAFGGELHDSLNHAWSAVLPWLAMRGLAGMREVGDGSSQLSFTPALHALDACKVRGVLPQGPWELSWTRHGRDGRKVEISLPPGVTATVVLPHGEQAVTGVAHITVA